MKDANVFARTLDKAKNELTQSNSGRTVIYRAWLARVLKVWKTLHTLKHPRRTKRRLRTQFVTAYESIGVFFRGIDRS